MAPERLKVRTPRPTAWVSRRLSDLPTPPEVVQARELRERARKQGLVIEYHLLLLLTLGLVAFGLIMVYSSSSGVAVVAGGNSTAAPSGRASTPCSGSWPWPWLPACPTAGGGR